MIKLSTGNKKLAAVGNVRFLIWNLPAVITCPNRTPSCERLCYARKAERIYPQVLPCRLENLAETQRKDFVTNMVQTIRKEVSKRSYVGKRVLFRIHESGDFYSEQYARDWLAIARAFPGIKFLAYTKSLPFFDGLELPENFTLRASVWHDTETDMLNRIMDNNYPIYTALPKEELSTSGSVICNCNIGCGACGMCWNKNIVPIATAIH